MTHATFTDTTGTMVTGPFYAVRDHVAYLYPDAIIHGTSVNDGRTEFGKFVGHDQDGIIRAFDPFAGRIVAIGTAVAA